MPKKSPPKKKPSKRPSERWTRMAVQRGYKTVNEFVDDFLSQATGTWSSGDVQKAMGFLWGAAQGIAVQLGRIESLLGHSGYAHPDMVHHMCMSSCGEGYRVVCESMKDKRTEEGFLTERTLQELMDAIVASSMKPNKPVATKEQADNVVLLPLLQKKGD